MFWGAALSYIGGAERQELSGFVTPDPLNQNVGNGSGVVVGEVTVTVAGGAPPYTFLWESADGSISFSAASAQTTNLLVTGTDEEHIGSYNCVVTDTLLNVISPAANFDIIQGSPP